MGNDNTAVGYYALVQSKDTYNTGIGYAAGASLTGNNNIDLNNPGVAGESGVIRIGGTNQKAAYIAGVATSGVTGLPVYVNSNGQLGVMTSSRRFKQDIKRMGTAGDRLLRLRPVTFRYKQADETGAHPLQFGLIAEEVAKVCPELVKFDKQGKPFTVYYQMLAPMLLNELQKMHRSSVAMDAAYKAQIAAQNTKIAAPVTAQEKQAQEMAKMTALMASLQNTRPTQKTAVFVKQ